MGVQACDRRGCDHIMCDKVSHRYGYICWECFEELVKSGPTTNIEEFMGKEKAYDYCDENEARARYEVVFEDR